jgi:hypothetical protein
MLKSRILSIATFLLSFNISVQGQQAVELMRLKDQHAKQAVAVDKDYIYVIDNSVIVKRSKATGEVIHQWQDTTGVITHLNSGVVEEGKLYCASSNYPDVPMASVMITKFVHYFYFSFSFILR